MISLIPGDRGRGKSFFKKEIKKTPKKLKIDGKMQKPCASHDKP